MLMARTHFLGLPRPTTALAANPRNGGFGGEWLAGRAGKTQRAALKFPEWPVRVALLFEPITGYSWKAMRPPAFFQARINLSNMLPSVS